MQAWRRERRHRHRHDREAGPPDPREPGDRPLRRDRRPGQAQAAAGDVPPRPGRVDAAALPDRRGGAARGRRRGVPPAVTAGDRGLRSRGPLAGDLGPVRRIAGVRRRGGRVRGARRGGLCRARGARRRSRPPLLPLAAAQGRRRHGRRARRARARRRRPGDHREAVRHRPRLGPRAERAAAHGLRGALHLPDRPLPGTRGGAEPAGAALRQRHVRAGLEPQPHRPRPDRHPGDALDRDARQLLRADRRLPRHDRHPPLPAARLRRDGAADLVRAEGAGPRAREGLRLDAAALAGERGPRPVRRLPRRGRASPPTPTPRPSSRSGPSSTTGAGRACRSTCAPASGWPRAATC